MSMIIDSFHSYSIALCLLSGILLLLFNSFDLGDMPYGVILYKSKGVASRNLINFLSEIFALVLVKLIMLDLSGRIKIVFLGLIIQSISCQVKLLFIGFLPLVCWQILCF